MHALYRDRWEQSKKSELKDECIILVELIEKLNMIWLPTLEC